MGNVCNFQTFILLTVLAAAGCSKSDSTAMNTSASKPPPAKTHSVWQPDPGWASELTQTLTFDKYQLSAPKYLHAVPEATKTAGTLNLFTWRIESGTEVPKAVLTAAISDDKQLLAESKSNMTKSM